MNQVDEIAKIAEILNCTKSNVYYLLRKGYIKRTYTDSGWYVTEEAIQDYAKTRKTNKYKLQKGQQFGYWTVLVPRVAGTDKYIAQCQCTCGTIKNVGIPDLVYGKSKSCGCRRCENQTQEQIEGRKQGKAILSGIHDEGLFPKYIARKPSRSSSTGHIGVSWHKRKQSYQAHITVNNHLIFLGYFKNLEDAIAARKAGEEKYFREKQDRVDAIKREYQKKKLQSKD